MKVGSATVYKVLKVLRKTSTKFLAFLLGRGRDSFHNVRLLIVRPQVWHSTSIQQIVDIFNKRFLFDLRVIEQKHC